MADARTLILGTAGHIDHGKTALVHRLTGTDTDRLPEERARGITIDLGFARLDLATPSGPVRLGVVDVPGHERFIRNMLAGASGIDLALLVVATDDSVMPQTREHLAILGYLGVSTGVIALTKCDRSDADWVGLVEDDVRALVAGTFLERAEIVRTSALAGDGITELNAALARAAATVTAEDAARPFRMAVDRAFVREGLGTVVTGSVASGSVAVGDDLDWHALAPDVRAVSVRGAQSHGETIERVGRGGRAALVLGGVRHDEITRGHELAAPGYLRPSSWITGALRVVPDSPRPLRHRARVRLHVGTAEVAARVVLLEGTALEPGHEDVVQFVLARPVVVGCGQPFVIRAESPAATLGGGSILEPVARRRRRADADGRAALRALRAADPTARVRAAFERAGTTALLPLEVAREADVAPGAAEALVEQLERAGELVTIPVPPQRTLRLARTVLERLEERAMSAVRTCHESAPLELRAARSAVARRLRDLDERIVDGVLDALVADGRLRGDGRGVADPGFRPRITQRQHDLAGALERAFETAAFGPPDPEAVAVEHGARPRDVRPAIEVCVGRGDLVHIGGGAYLHARWEAELRDRTRRALSAGAGLTMSELKELFGTSRKFAVPFGEYLDRVGVTRRVGDRRVLKG